MVKRSVYLGPLSLWWCPECDIPLISPKCGICGGEGKGVTITPPGDIRPAFPYDLKLVSTLITQAFSPQPDSLSSLFDSPVLLNRVPAEDKAYELIAQGMILAHLRYDLRMGWRLIPRMPLASALAPDVGRGWIVVDDGAVGPISMGRSVLLPGVVDIDPKLRVGDSVIVLDAEGKAIATGTMRMDGDAVINASKGAKGAVVKIKHCDAKDPSHLKAMAKDGVKGREWGDIWGTVVKGNAHALEKLEGKGRERILSAVRKHPEKALVVAFSGGKDSMASLLITLSAGLKPTLLFNDTGIEFSETIELVKDVAESYGLDLIQAPAGPGFEHGFEHFGPPAKDYRWCCKVCKLGPTVKAIQDNFPKGIVSIIGQRRYESLQRARKGSEWENPWVPGQMALSPIQNWTALAVWLYLFYKGARYNPWYERGLDRIGCYLCPSTDMGEMKAVATRHEGFKSFLDRLKGYFRDLGLSEGWVEYGLWRWRNHPSWVWERFPEVLKERELIANYRLSTGGLVFHKVEGYRSCVDEYTLEGAFNRPLNMERTSEMLGIFGPVKSGNGVAEVEMGDKGLTVFAEGGVVVRAKEEGEAHKLLSLAREVIIRAHECVGCSICVGRCPKGALSIQDGRVRVENEGCIHCLQCLEGPCPATAYRDF